MEETANRTDAAGSGNNLALLAITSGKFVTIFQVALLVAAVPTMLKAFDSDLRTMGWFSMMYLVCRYALMISVGHLGDRVGRKKVYVSGLALFTVSVAIAAFAINIPMLVVTGALMGFAAGMIRATFPGLVVACSPPGRTGRAFGGVNTLINCALLIGPFVGGVIVMHASWRFIFIANFPLCVASLLLCMRYVEESKGVEEKPVDGKGALLLLATFAPMAIGLQLTRHQGWASPVVLTLVASALVAGWLFQRHGRSVLFPVVDLSLLRRPRFGLANATLVFQSAGLEIFFFAAPFFLQGYFGLLPDRAGLLLSVVGIATVAVTYLSGRAADSIGSLPMEMSGLLLLGTAFALIGFTRSNTSYLVVFAAMLLAGLGDGLFDPANVSEVMKSIPRSELGVAGGINETANELGKIFAIPLAEIAMGEWAKLKLASGGTQMAANPRLLEAVDNVYLVAFGAAMIALAICVLRIRYVRKTPLGGCGESCAPSLGTSL